VTANKTLHLEIRITIRSGDYGGNQLSLTEDLTLTAGDFMEMCTILGQFSQLSDKIKEHK